MNEIVTDGWRSGGAWLLPGKSTADRIQLLIQIQRQLPKQKKGKLRHNSKAAHRHHKQRQRQQHKLNNTGDGRQDTLSVRLIQSTQ